MASPSFTAHPFLLSVKDVAEQLDTNIDNGLTDVQVKQRQEKYGLNELEVQEPTPWYSILFKQFCNAMIIVSAPEMQSIVDCTLVTHLSPRSSSSFLVSPLASATTSKAASWLPS